jgi:methyl-accepting chemotaxis protein
MVRSLSIGAKIIIACMAIVIIAVCSFALYFDHRQYGEISENLQAKVDEEGALASRTIAAWLGGRLSLVENLRDNVATHPDPTAVREFIAHPAVADRFMAAYFGSAQGGMYMFPDDPLPATYDPRVRPWYKGAQASGASFITSPYVDTSSGELVVTLAAPVGKGAQTLGTVGGDLTLTELIELVQSIDVGGLGYGFLVDSAGTVLIHPNQALTLKPMTEALPDYGVSLSDSAARKLTDSGDGRLVSFTPVTVIPGVTWYLGLSVERDAAYAPLSRFRVTMAITTALMLIGIVGLVGYMIHRLVSKPLTAMTGVMGALEEGTLTVNIPYTDRGDEMGRMASAVLHFQQQLVHVRRLEDEKEADARKNEQRRKEDLTQLLSNLKVTVGEVVNDVAAAANDMNDSASGMRSVAQTTSAQATNASNAADEASHNVQTVAAAAEQLSASSADIGRQVGQSRQIAHEAEEEVTSTSAVIEALSADVVKIGDVVKLITDIASQTNLLALNATIESARAGEAGKGFAVVANEVKSLANQTSRATEQIAQSIESVQTGTQQAVQAIQGINSVIARVGEIAVSVSSAVEEQHAATSEIARSVEKASGGTADVSDSVASVKMAASDTGASADRIAQSSHRLSELARRLQQQVDAFVQQASAEI